MAAYFCRNDKLSVPRKAALGELGGNCPICGQPLEFFANKMPDPDWAEKAEVEPDTTHPAEDSAQVIVRNDQAFVQDSTLRKLGYDGILLRPDDIVKLNGKYYEIQGFDKRLKVWWIQHFDFKGWKKRAIDPLRVTRGPSSDDIIALDGDPTVFFNTRTGEMVAGNG